MVYASQLMMPSLASQLPHVLCGFIVQERHKICGSWLASEAGASVYQSAAG
jgi:hypothetical protein